MRISKRIVPLALIASIIAIFWNWLPLAYTFRTLCKQDAGFSAYITPREWATSNREALKNIDINNLEAITSWQETTADAIQYHFFGGLLLRISRATTIHRYGMDIWRSENLLIDVKSGSPMTKWVDYLIGPQEDVRIWLTQRSCFSERQEKPVDTETRFKEQIKEEIK